MTWRSLVEKRIEMANLVLSSELVALTVYHLVNFGLPLDLLTSLSFAHFA